MTRVCVDERQWKSKYKPEPAKSKIVVWGKKGGPTDLRPTGYFAPGSGFGFDEYSLLILIPSLGTKEKA